MQALDRAKIALDRADIDGGSETALAELDAARDAIYQAIQELRRLEGR